VLVPASKPISHNCLYAATISCFDRPAPWSHRTNPKP
jgi:hypothetical protein